MYMDLKDIQRQIDLEMKKQNNRSIPEFEGYSPFEMSQILYFPFEQDSPIKMLKLSDADYASIPIFNQMKYLMGLLEKNGEIKLTKKGFLPTKVVADIYRQGFLKEKYIELGISKLYKESDSLSINLTRILLELSGLIKKRKGIISLTKRAHKMLGDNEELFRHIFLTYTKKFNWAYCDGYGDSKIGQFGYGFSLILLSKYGQMKREDTFYAEKYFKAYPPLLNTLEPTYGTLERYATNCYSYRLFNVFLVYFGLIRIEKDNVRYDSPKYIIKTELFDRLIKIQPHTVV